jgi:hypothetical protein
MALCWYRHFGDAGSLVHFKGGDRIATSIKTYNQQLGLGSIGTQSNKTVVMVIARCAGVRCRAARHVNA